MEWNGIETSKHRPNIRNRLSPTTDNAKVFVRITPLHIQDVDYSVLQANPHSIKMGNLNSRETEKVLDNPDFKQFTQNLSEFLKSHAEFQKHRTARSHARSERKYGNIAHQSTQGGQPNQFTYPIQNTQAERYQTQEHRQAIYADQTPRRGFIPAGYEKYPSISILSPQDYPQNPDLTLSVSQIHITPTHQPNLNLYPATPNLDLDLDLSRNLSLSLNANHT